MTASISSCLFPSAFVFFFQVVFWFASKTASSCRCRLFSFSQLQSALGAADGPRVASVAPAVARRVLLVVLASVWLSRPRRAGS